MVETKTYVCLWCGNEQSTDPASTDPQAVGNFCEACGKNPTLGRAFDIPTPKWVNPNAQA